jgi:hypothetical protein
MFLHRLLEETPRGGLYIGVLSQAERSGAKMDDIGGTTAKRHWVARPGMGLVPPMLVWALVAHFNTSSS